MNLEGITLKHIEYRNAELININFSRQNVYKKKLNPISTVIATENWIIKTTLYNVHFAHQSDTSLSVAKVRNVINTCVGIYPLSSNQNFWYCP